MTVAQNADGHTFAELYDTAIKPDAPDFIDCPECEGTGESTCEVFRPMSFGNDFGDFEEVILSCENCGGNGQIEPMEDE